MSTFVGCPHSKNTAGLDAWMVSFRPLPQAPMRLFCFSYAGGSSAAYREWANGKMADVEICAIELPGRGARIRERPLSEMQPLVEQVARALPLDKQFAFFGHSVGALVAFETARQLRRCGLELPTHFFASACRGPRLPDTDPPRHAMGEVDLLRELTNLGGTPQDLLSNRDFMQVFLPAIRADLSLSENYAYVEEPPLPCAMTAYGGLDDAEVKSYELAAWQCETTSRFRKKVFPGDHFYINGQQKPLLEDISSVLALYSIYIG